MYVCVYNIYIYYFMYLNKKDIPEQPYELWDATTAQPGRCNDRHHPVEPRRRERCGIPPFTGEKWIEI